MTRKLRCLRLFCSLALAALALGVGRPAHAAPVAPSLIQIAGPGAVEAPIVALIDGARRRVLVEAYALNDAPITSALQRAARRGVDVRVMLDPLGLNTAATLVQLQGAGIRTRPPDRQDYAVTHLSMLVVDTSGVAVLTTALTSDAVGVTGHGYLAVDRDRYDVLQAASLFYDDWLRRPVNTFGHNLLIFPSDGSLAQVTSLIDQARWRLEVYTPALSDPSVLSSLQTARSSRHVVVSVLTRSSTQALTPLIAGGRVRLRDDGSGSIVIVDRRTVLLTSADLSQDALTHHRELGIVVNGQVPANDVDNGFFFPEFARGRLVLPPQAPQRGHTVVVGTLKVTANVTPLVRPGGEGVISLSTTPGAAVSIVLTYPAGSKVPAAATKAQGHADKRGTFVYRWIVSDRVKPGTATARITVRYGRTTLVYTARFTVAR